MHFAKSKNAIGPTWKDMGCELLMTLSSPPLWLQKFHIPRSYSPLSPPKLGLAISMHPSSKTKNQSTPRADALHHIQFPLKSYPKNPSPELFEPIHGGREGNPFRVVGDLRCEGIDAKGDGEGRSVVGEGDHQVATGTQRGIPYSKSGEIVVFGPFFRVLLIFQLPHSSVVFLIFTELGFIIWTLTPFSTLPSLFICVRPFWAFPPFQPLLPNILSQSPPLQRKPMPSWQF